MGPDEAAVFDRVLQLPDALHAHERVYAQQAGKAVGMGGHGVRHQARRQMVATGQAQTAGLGGDQEGALSASLVHAV